MKTVTLFSPASPFTMEDEAENQPTMEEEEEGVVCDSTAPPRMAISDRESCVRHLELGEALSSVGVTLHPGSKVCSSYISGHLNCSWDIPRIVGLMCEMKFLFEHTNYKFLCSRYCETLAQEIFHSGMISGVTIDPEMFHIAVDMASLVGNWNMSWTLGRKIGEMQARNEVLGAFGGTFPAIWPWGVDLEEIAAWRAMWARTDELFAALDRINHAFRLDSGLSGGFIQGTLQPRRVRENVVPMESTPMESTPMESTPMESTPMESTPMESLENLIPWTADEVAERMKKADALRRQTPYKKVMRNKIVDFSAANRGRFPGRKDMRRLMYESRHEALNNDPPGGVNDPDSCGRSDNGGGRGRGGHNNSGGRGRGRSGRGGRGGRGGSSGGRGSGRGRDNRQNETSSKRPSNSSRHQKDSLQIANLPAPSAEAPDRHVAMMEQEFFGIV
jgi:uncharacterized membrane protein YgcG